jgi:serine/threonine-protein kinase
VVIGVAFFLWSEARARLRHPASEQGAQTASTTEPLPTATTATKSPEQVKLRITASPANAKLLLDDVPITPNPYSTSLPADGATHTIRAEAAGYEAESQIFASDKDANFTLSLKAADKSGQKTQAQSKRRVQPAISGSAAKAEPNCTPAYIVDDDGIKMFKAECM